MSDLIAAVATPPGTGGVGILRLSGPGAAQAAARVFRPKGTRALPDAPDRQLLYGTLLDQAGQALDTGLAFVSRAPHSYTGEETAELQCHGSPMVLSLVLDALFAAGARQARAGEFTQRAFLNGKLDLTQAEAVIDLIEAETPAAARQAAGQLTGALSRRIDAIYSGLTDVMAHFCAVLDYPDEDLDPFQTQQLQEALQAQEEALTALLRTSRRGRLLSQGLTCVLLGRPNAGKSSLLNALAGYERAIVTGEFTQRAFLNGKLDLTQAEAVIDLIEAETPAAARQAAGQLTGALSRRIDAIYSGLTDVMAHFCAVLDYPDEDLDPFQTQQLQEALQAQEEALTALLRTSRRGRLLSQGLTCVLLGRPNAGKSSLLNALAGYERAIVTPIPGTTRDTVEATVTLEGYLFRLVDTAGLRDSDDPIEQLGVARSRQALDQADLILLVCDGTQELGEEDTALLDQALDQADTLLVMNKSDLPGYGCPMFRAENTAHTLSVVGLSAKTGLGLEFLEAELVRRAQALLPQAGQRASELLLTNQRQTDAVRRAAESVARAGQALEQGVTPDALLTDVEQAMAALGELTGRTVREDITSRIFQRFCVGK